MASVVKQDLFDFEALFKSHSILEKRGVFVGKDSNVPASIEVNFIDRNNIWYNLKTDKDELGILSLSVSPDEVYMGQIRNYTCNTASKVNGVGSALMDHSFLFSEATNRELTLDSEPAAKGFHEKFGFVQVVRPLPDNLDPEENPLPEIIMRLPPAAKAAYRERLSNIVYP